MANKNTVASALGTQKQFGKQPVATYQKSLVSPNFGHNISIGVDEDARVLAHSLGVLGNDIVAESIAADRREREQLTTDDAQRMIAGKTTEDLKDFDVVQALQHSNKGFDLSDNPYAVAALDTSIGQVAAMSARDKYLENNPGVPKSINEAIAGYNEALKETYGDFESNINNKYAFDKGFYGASVQEALSVARTAGNKINAERKSQGQRATNVKMQNLMLAADRLDNAAFAEAFGQLSRELQFYVDTSDDALSIIQGNLAILVENETSTEKLNALKDTVFFGSDRKLGEEIPFFNYYKKIAENFDKTVAGTIYTNSQNADGTVNWDKVNKALASLPETALSNAIPQVNLPHYSGDLDNLTPELKEVLPSVGGVLSILGYGDVAEYTSGYRDPELNASVNGSATSYHLGGNAVDVYLGDLSQDEQEEVRATFSPYFREVLYHDAGSGTHLHLGGYLGGLDNHADNAESTAAAYSPERKKKIMQLLEARDADARRVAKQRQQELYEGTLRNVMTAGSQEEALQAVMDAELPYSQKQKLIKSINSQYKNINKGNLTFEDKYWLRYEKNKLYSDVDTLKEYERLLSEPDAVVDDDMQEKANAASRRMNDYWKYSIPSYREKLEAEEKQTKEIEKAIVQPAANEALMAEIRADVAEAKKRGYTQAQIMDKLIQYADEQGLDPVTVLEQINMEEDNE